MSKRILIMDDDEALRLWMTRVLERAGYVVEVLESGFDVENISADFMPDLIISDVMMPGRDGFELCQQLKAKPTTSQLPVVLISGMNREGTKQKALAAGAAAFLSKPVHEEDLLSAVQKALS